MKKLSIKYIRKVMNKGNTFSSAKGMNIAVDTTGFRTSNSSTWILGSNEETKGRTASNSISARFQRI
jgi:hypothetical protein